MGNAGKKGTHSTKVKFAACPGCGPGRDDKIATRYKRGKKENAPHNVRCAAWERQLAAGAGGRARTGTVSPPVDFEFYRLRGNEWTVIPYGGP